MGTVVSRLSWVEWNAGIAIAARATRRFAQSAIAVLIAIYLGLHGFSLGQVGAFLTVGAVGAASGMAWEWRWDWGSFVSPISWAWSLSLWYCWPPQWGC